MNQPGSKLKGRALSSTVLRAVLFATLGFLLPISMLRAQETASIVGTVTDQSGALMPGAKVTLVNQETQFTRVVETNTSGQYVASAIPTGGYAITVEKAGFKQLRRTGIQLTLASTLTVDLQLSVGAVTQTVAVSGTPPLLHTQSAAVSGLVDSRQMLALPLVSRDFTDLVLLTPGAHIGTAGNLAEGGSGYSMLGGDNYSVNGSVAAGNTYMVNGIFDRNLAPDPLHRATVQQMQKRLGDWMIATNDPLLRGPVKAPPGARINPQNQISPSDPVEVVP